MKVENYFFTKAIGCWPLVIIPLTLVIRHSPFVLFFGRSGYRRRAFRSIFARFIFPRSKKPKSIVRSLKSELRKGCRFNP